MKHIAILLILVLMVGCGAKPIASDQTQNPDLKVDYLGESDGCKIYRFLDVNYHYYVRCNGHVTTSETQQNGKAKRITEIPTIEQ